MKTTRLIELDYSKRLNQVLDESWMIFRSQFISNRHKITKEAPFQHHFAQIIKSVGDLYSICEKDLFKVDLETKEENISGKKNKYIDITCQYDDKISCAIELKFKTKTQGAQDHSQIDVYSDIKALEIMTEVERGYDFGKFYMITDDELYTKPTQKRDSPRAIFEIHDNHETEAYKTFTCPTCKGRENINLQLKNSYHFQWEESKDWYFLDLTIPK